MDHLYAAAAPSTSVEAHTTSPSLTPYLLDHNFARPPTESPPVTNSKKTVLSPKARKLSNGQDEGQSSPAKTPTKHGKRARHSSRRKRSARKSSATTSADEEDSEFIAVATMASAPNSPAGLRSLLAEHLLSARSLVTVGPLDFGSAGEDTLAAGSQSDSQEDEKRGETEGVKKALDSSGKWNSEECPEEGETVLRFDQESEGEMEQCHSDGLPLQHDQADTVTSVSFPKVRSVLTAADRDQSVKSSENQGDVCGSNDLTDVSVNSSVLPSDQTPENAFCESVNEDGKETSQFLDAGMPDPKDLSENKSSTNSLSSCSGSNITNNDSRRHEVGDKSVVADIPDSVEPVESDLTSNRTETNPKSNKTSDSKKSAEQSPVPINSSMKSEKGKKDQADSAEVVSGAKLNPKTCDVQATVPNESGPVSVSTNSSSSSHTVVTYSICEAVKLKKQISAPTKDRNEISKSNSKRARVGGKKRTAAEAGLDDSQSDISPDHVAASQSQAKSSLEPALTQSSSSTPTTPKRGRPKGKGKTKTPAKKPVLPKADASDLPDISMYLTPLKKYGWKRELVLRGVFDERTSSGTKRKNPPADVYYFTPEGRKLRSRVMISSYLDEHPEGTLTVDNFTFIRKPICEEPWETVRQAGKSCGRRPQKESRISPSHVSPSQNTPKISRVKIKIGTGATKKVTIITDTPSSSSSKTPTTSHSSSRKSTYIRYDDDEEDDGNDYDEDYDPWKDDQTPKWNKTRSIFHRQKGRRRSRQSPTREVLIQSMPEPDIIIDRAEESPHIDESDASKKEKTRDVSESKAPRMMLLPGEIKEETLDVDGEAEGEDKDDNNSNDIGTVHIHCSPPVKRVHTKPTARKSTMPRIALKKSSNSSSKAKELILSDGQLCSNTCPGLDGAAPSLQCCICMCLFHHQCVNINPDELIPCFKCLRCKDVPTSHNTANWPPEKPPSLISSSSVSTSMSATPMSSAPPLHRLVYMHTPFQPAVSGVSDPSTHPFQQPFVSVTTANAAPQGPGTRPKTDAIQLLRNLTTAKSSAATAPAPVRPGPVPPQLIRGGAAPPSLQPNKLPLPPLRMRPPPRLTAAPGIVVSSVQPAPTSMAVATNSSSSPKPTLVLSSRRQPQPQMMTLPASLLSHLNLSQPLAVKLNNAQVVVPPSCIISTKDGLKPAFSSMKVLLPPSTFPLPPDSNTKVSVTISNNAITTTAGAVPATTTSTSRESHSVSRLPAASSQVNSSEELSDGVQTRRCRQRRVPVGIDFTQCVMHRLFGGFDCMLQIFRYLHVVDLLRAGQVCRTWLQIARQRCLWQKLDLTGLRVTHWDRATDFIRSVGTQTLCLQNLHHGSNSNSEWMQSWSQVTNNLDALQSLRSIEFGLVPPSVLHAMAEKLTGLEVLRAEHISDFCDEQMWTTKTKLDVGKLACLTELQELRLRGVSGLALPTFTFSGNLSELAQLSHLHTLSLTSLCALRDSEYHFLSDLKQLQVLELGDCLNWTSQTYSLLGELQELRRLRLECGGEIPDIGVGEAIAKLTKLERLELILFAIPASLESSLSQLPHLHTLVVWPDTSHDIMPAVVNSHAMTAVVNLTQLKTLIWGVVIKHSPEEAIADSPATEKRNTIPLLLPGTTLDPEAERDSHAVINMTVTEFTEKLCLSLPSSTAIKVFNTQVVCRSGV